MSNKNDESDLTASNFSSLNSDSYSPYNKKRKDHFEEEKFFLDDAITLEHNKSNIYREPMTHVKNRSALENILGSCFGDFDAKITYNQLLPFYKLKEDANVLFDAKCKDYDDIFRELWAVFMNNETLEKIENEKWKDFGFQNSNPRSDLRGGGLISLKQMVHYAKEHPTKVKEMVDPKHEFCYAISSINITYFLFRYYHLSDLLTYEKDWKEICSRIALKTFCTLLETDKAVFDKMHCLLLEDLFDVWLEVRKNLPNVTLLDFHIATDTIKARFKRATEKKVFEEFETLKIYYNNKKPLNPPILKTTVRR